MYFLNLGVKGLRCFVCSCEIGMRNSSRPGSCLVTICERGCSGTALYSRFVETGQTGFNRNQFCTTGQVWSSWSCIELKLSRHFIGWKLAGFPTKWLASVLESESKFLFFFLFLIFISLSLGSLGARKSIRSQPIAIHWIRRHADHLPTTHRPHTGHMPTTYRLHTDHMSTTYRPHTGHMPTSYRPHTDYIPTTCPPHTDHIPATCQLHTDHMPTTYRPPVFIRHLPSSCFPDQQRLRCRCYPRGSGDSRWKRACHQSRWRRKVGGFPWPVTLRNSYCRLVVGGHSVWSMINRLVIGVQSLIFVCLFVRRKRLFIWNNIFFSFAFDSRDHYQQLGGAFGWLCSFAYWAWFFTSGFGQSRIVQNASLWSQVHGCKRARHCGLIAIQAFWWRIRLIFRNKLAGNFRL